jgi:hypothetical protein
MDDAVGNLTLVGGKDETCFQRGLYLEELHVMAQEGKGREETIGACMQAAHGMAISDAVTVLLWSSVGRDGPVIGAICSACVEDLDAGTGCQCCLELVGGLQGIDVPDKVCVLSQCIQHPVPVLHSRLYFSLTITNAQDQSCSNQEPMTRSHFRSALTITAVDSYNLLVAGNLSRTLRSRSLVQPRGLPLLRRFGVRGLLRPLSASSTNPSQRACLTSYEPN